jgi:NADH:ubiquinone oxidoreductase subunit C
MAKELSADQIQSAAEALVGSVAEKFTGSATAEVRHHTGGRRKNAYVYIDVEAAAWRDLATWLAKSHKVDHCSMITGIHWPEKADATWQVVAHLMRTGVRNPGVVSGRVHEIKVDIDALVGVDVPLEFEISMTLAETREPSVPSVADIWVGADWNEKETWDLVGIEFEGHVGMRRVLLPHDSPTGYHPLQKQHKLHYHDFNEMYDDAQGFGRKPEDVGRVK